MNQTHQIMQTILVVDDDPMIRQLLRSMLTLAGYEVEEVGDGLEGLSCCVRRRYDLVIIDLMMPKRDGLTMIADLRLADPSATILALSGSSNDKLDLLGTATKLGADDVSQKPFDVTVFLSKVQTLLIHRHVQPATARTPA